MPDPLQQPSSPGGLFDPRAHARADDPPTSHAAARSIRDNLSRLRQWVHGYVDAAKIGGVTQDEAVRAYRRDNPFGSHASSTITGRFKELESLGLIRRTERTRKTASGRAAQVWVSASC